MIVALGGDDPRLSRWAAPITACGGTVVPVVGPGQSTGVVTPPTTSTVASGGMGQPPRAAILSGSATSVLQAARSVGESTPLYIVPAAHDAPTIAYGLLPHVEDGRLAIPGWTHRAAAAVGEYIARFTRGDLGELRLLRLERTHHASDSAGTAAIPPGLLSRSDIEEQFFHDVDLLRLIGGDYNRITALEIGAEVSGVRQRTVTLAGDDVPEAVWSIQPGSTNGWRLTVTGDRGSAELSGESGGRISLAMAGEPLDSPRDDHERESVRRFLHELSAATPPPLDPTRPEWGDYVRAADLLQGMQRSLLRRRTIDLHFESTSERSQFKTQMTAIGCGVLTWALLGTCLGLVLGQALDPRDGTERRAAAAGTIVWRTDFPEGSDTPEATVMQRLVRQVEIDGAESIILIERDADNASTSIDSERLEATTAALRAAANGRLIPQVEVRPLAGRWFRWGMLAIWGVTFGPLAVFLVTQGLIVLTRSPVSDELPAQPPA